MAEFLGEVVFGLLFEWFGEALCDVCFCGLWSDRDAGFDRKRKSVKGP